jgi:hypothetical protein
MGGLVTGHILKATEPMLLPAEEMHELLAGINPSSLLGLRDRTPYVGHDSDQDPALSPGEVSLSLRVTMPDDCLTVLN